MRYSILLIVTILAISLSAQDRLENGEYMSFAKQVQKQVKQNRSFTSLDYTWTAEENISNHTGEDSRYPRIAVGNDGTVYSVFTDRGYQSLGYASNQKIVFSKKEPGQDWTPQVVIDENGYPSRNNSSSAIAVDDNNNIHVVFLAWAMENMRLVMAYTKFDNSTQTWTTPINISTAGGSIYDTYPIQIVLSDEGNPLVVWGDDNRIDEDTEKLYGTYFNGSVWSEDILISGNDTLEAVQPVIEKIDGNKAMIVYKKEISNEADSLQLKYGFFDFSSFEFSEFNTIPNTKTTKSLIAYNYDIEYAPMATGNNLYLAYWKHEYPVVGDLTDQVNIVNYDIDNDIFTLSEHELSFTVNNYLYKKRINLACNSNSELSLIFNNGKTMLIEVSKYNPLTGFATPESLSTNPSTVSESYPSSQFNSEGKLCVVFTDERNYGGSGYIERDVFYREGTDVTASINEKNFDNKISIYPNPASDFITVTGSILKEKKIQILDVTGKLAKQVNTQDLESRIRISDLQSGVYFIKIGTRTSKFIKQ